MRAREHTLVSGWHAYLLQGQNVEIRTRPLANMGIGSGRISHGRYLPCASHETAPESARGQEETDWERERGKGERKRESGRGLGREQKGREKQSARNLSRKGRYRGTERGEGLGGWGRERGKEREKITRARDRPLPMLIQPASER